MTKRETQEGRATVYLTSYVMALQVIPTPSTLTLKLKLSFILPIDISILKPIDLGCWQCFYHTKEGQ